jgi:ABC-type sugar transport system permease subunit
MMAKNVEKQLSDKEILRILQRGTRQNFQAYMFLLPWLIGFVLFTIVPFFYTIYLSFFVVTQTGLGYEREFIGLGNYIVALFENTEFVPALFEFILVEITYVPTIVILSFILGLLLNRELKFRAGFRTIFFLPVIVLSGSAMDQLVATGSTALSDFDNNIIFEMVHSYSPFLADIMLGLFTNFTMVLWFTGIPIILFINALQKINKSLFEAAKIDGATSWQILWKITIPIIKPTALVSAIFTIVQIGMYNINPVYGIIRAKMYEIGGGLGLASALTWVYSFVVIIFVGVAFLLLGNKEKKTEIKLTSIQRKNYQNLLARRARLEEEATYENTTVVD